MAYRLKDCETLPEGIRRISLAQLDRAIDRLEHKTGSRDRAVHEARVCFKKVRAVLRLVHGEIGTETYKFENRTYRDAGRQLSAARDTAVLASALEELVHRFEEALADSDIKSLRKHLRSARARQQIGGQQVLFQVAELVRSARQRIETWSLDRDSFAAVRFGIKRVYRQGLIGFESARAETTTENLHEWRKQVKYLLYQVSLLNPIWPKPMDTLADELGKLADYLSEDHDLALLRRTAVQTSGVTDHDATERLLVFADERRSQLQSKALSLGARLYTETPKRFANRLRAYWEVWRPTSVEPVKAEQLTFAAYAAGSQS